MGEDLWLPKSGSRGSSQRPAPGWGRSAPEATRPPSSHGPGARAPPLGRQGPAALSAGSSVAFPHARGLSVPSFCRRGPCAVLWDGVAPSSESPAGLQPSPPPAWSPAEATGGTPRAPCPLLEPSTSTCPSQPDIAAPHPGSALPPWPPPSRCPPTQQGSHALPRHTWPHTASCVLKMSS